jgi:hypothetical protein
MNAVLASQSLNLSPAACPSRICSNSSTLTLLFIPESFHSGFSGEPNETIKLGQFRGNKLLDAQDLLRVVHPVDLGRRFRLLWDFEDIYRVSDLHSDGNRLLGP